ncbi:MAG TPA: DUF2125 domain-containing protein [Pseudolabrys sp.]|nr:DUF2125 domain-containing protein [Pseudolabrys sp.]
MAAGYSPRRRNRRYIALVAVVVALFAGWSAVWYFAVRQAEVTMAGWRAREAKAGRDYACATQTFGGYPFRFEVNCEQPTAVFHALKPPVEIAAANILVAAQIYQPDLLISEVKGPLTIADQGKPPAMIADWTLLQTSVRGTPMAPERVALVFDEPGLDRVAGGTRQPLVRAKHVEIHGRIAEGSVTDNPVVEAALDFDDASLPGLHPAAAAPMDGEIVAMLRGLHDFSPKPWPVRFREIQAANGRIDITRARVQQGDILAVGSGALSLNANGRLEGQLRVTIAGLEQFLNKIGAQQLVQNSSAMDRVAGTLDRLMPGLGGLARQQAGQNISAGINLIGEPTTLEGRRAVTVPLRFSDGAVFLGPVPIGKTPALF